MDAYCIRLRFRKYVLNSWSKGPEIFRTGPCAKRPQFWKHQVIPQARKSPMQRRLHHTNRVRPRATRSEYHIGQQ